LELPIFDGRLNQKRAARVNSDFGRVEDPAGNLTPF
jgi:hypothetical protein